MCESGWLWVSLYQERLWVLSEQESARRHNQRVNQTLSRGTESRFLEGVPIIHISAYRCGCPTVHKQVAGGKGERIKCWWFLQLTDQLLYQQVTNADQLTRQSHVIFEQQSFILEKYRQKASAEETHTLVSAAVPSPGNVFISNGINYWVSIVCSMWAC